MAASVFLVYLPMEEDDEVIDKHHNHVDHESADDKIQELTTLRQVSKLY